MIRTNFAPFGRKISWRGWNGGGLWKNHCVIFQASPSSLEGRWQTAGRNADDSSNDGSANGR